MTLLIQGQTSEMEWEDTMNTDDVTTSDTTGCSTDTDLMEKDEQEEDDEDPFAWGQHPCHHQSSHSNVSGPHICILCPIIFS